MKRRLMAKRNEKNDARLRPAFREVCKNDKSQGKDLLTFKVCTTAVTSRKLQLIAKNAS